MHAHMQSGRHAARLPARTGTELTHLARTDTRHRARQLRMKTRCPHPPCLRPTWRSTPPPPLFQACGACSRHRRCVLFVFVFPTSPAHKYFCQQERSQILLSAGEVGKTKTKTHIYSCKAQLCAVCFVCAVCFRFPYLSCSQIHIFIHV